MPKYRSEIESLRPYEVGRPIEEVARDLGLDADSIIRLTANESPEGPFPGVVEAVERVVGSSNRYPDNDLWELSHALGDELGVERDNLLFGAGSTALISAIVSATGGPETNIVYGWPSFVMYRFSAIWAGCDFIEVPLDGAFELDLDSMAESIDSGTRVVILCNPNNPTGTIKSPEAIEGFVADIPDDVVVVIDEAYHDYVVDPGYQTSVPAAVERSNVIVLRTFSKIYSLAAFRIGYAVGSPETLTQIRKAQAPLTVTTTAQAAALTSLNQPAELERRVEANAAARHHLSGAIAERGLDQIQSHTNFIYFRVPSLDSAEATARFTALGVILRPMSDGWLRVTLGSPDENRKFVAALDSVLAESV